MASVDSDALPPSGDGEVWQAVKAALMRELHYFKGITVVGLLGTLIAAYFQNLSTYEDKVAAQAKDDMTAAAQMLTDATTALSGAVSLQRRLLRDFYAAVPNDVFKNDNAYPTTDARAIYSDYMETYKSLHQNYNLLARRAEIYLDWPSNPAHDAATNTGPDVDPFNMSTLGEFDFDCETHMPDFANPRITLTDKHDGSTVVLDWNSAKHHVLTTQYCFDVTHQKMTAALEWASKSEINPADWDFMTTTNIADLFGNTRATNQVLRLNAFVNLAMGQIEKIRVKYRPNGYQCSLPILRQMLGNACLPVHTAMQ